MEVNTLCDLGYFYYEGKGCIACDNVEHGVTNCFDCFLYSGTTPRCSWCAHEFVPNEADG